MTATQIVETLLEKGYRIHTRPFELNIIGVRSNSTAANRFDDSIHLIYRDGAGRWIHVPASATTDPGTYWLAHPMDSKGTAILKAGQYEYQIGLHLQKYKALVQAAPVTVIRDYDRNAILDFKNGNEFTGYFGINIHRALQTGTTKEVDRHSAGCQVFSSVEDFDRMMQCCERHSSLYGNRFTYSLIDQRAESRKEKKEITYQFLAVGALTVTAAICYKTMRA